MNKRYTASTVPDGRQFRGIVYRGDGSTAYEGPPVTLRRKALYHAIAKAAAYNSAFK